MRHDSSFQEMADRDELIIPTKEGYVVIPVENLRGTSQQNRNHAHQGPHNHSGGSSVRHYRISNFLQFSLMMSGMVSLMAYIGWVIGGTIGLTMVAVISISTFVIGSNIKIEQMLKLKKVRQISSLEGFQLFDMVEKLARKAGLKRMPMLFLDDHEEINAFTMADKEKSAIVLSSGLLRHLNQQELYGVLAHEIAHLKNGDIRLMFFSDQMRRLTGYLSFAGQMLLLFYIPLALLGQVVFPWMLVVILVIAPLLSQLIQVGLSRNREFRADMEAVALSGDTVGLSAALRKISVQSSFWKRLYAPYINQTPELLRTHPNTEDRIERLQRIQEEKGSKLTWME